ncbi:hypothetical protein FKW77_003361 [Venturia effusa]|uniref:Aminoglycoside phosphotransferase domain-containing protein n=1 Tax=Venturia effusa TaxID=50376 RepID=A0A517L530_9PEZI|nr:hypothetical protein FKW77_003361 [Venturia effusa]
MLRFARELCRKVLRGRGWNPSRRSFSELTEEEQEDLTFGDVRKIAAEKLIQLANKHLGSAHGDCVIEGAKEGSYNRVNIMLFTDGTKCTIRIPAHGTVQNWTEEDAFELRSQALTMMLIKRKTDVPVPEVIAYNNSCDNDLGAPYMLTSFLEGKRICDVWGEGLDRITIAKETENEAMRLRILRSVAFTMSGLRALSFDFAGGLYFEHDLDDAPSIGAKFELEEPDYYTRTTSFGECYCGTSRYLESKLEEWCKLINPDTEEGILDQGRRHILELALDCLPGKKSTMLEDMRAHELLLLKQWGKIDVDDGVDEEVEREEEEKVCALTAEGNTPCPGPVETDTKANVEVAAAGFMAAASENVDQDRSSGDHRGEADSMESSTSTTTRSIQNDCETFVLVPPDFDWQNVLVDDDGNVTGLLDWDGVCTVPRFRGFASMPLWLQQDYSPEWHWEGTRGNSDHDLARYRRAYANFMAEAMNNEGDCKYTAKSPILDVLVAACHKENEGWADHAARTILRMLLPRTDITEYFKRIGDAEQAPRPGESPWLMERLKELLECKPGWDDRYCI